MFKQYPIRRLDPRTVSEGNLNARFASQGMGISFPVDCQHEFNGEPRILDEVGLNYLNREQVLVSGGKACH